MIMDSVVLPDLPLKQLYHIIIVCDGLAALNTVGIEKEYIKTSGKHVDLICTTTAL